MYTSTHRTNSKTKISKYVYGSSYFCELISVFTFSSSFSSFSILKLDLKFFLFLMLGTICIWWCWERSRNIRWNIQPYWFCPVCLKHFSSLCHSFSLSVTLFLSLSLFFSFCHSFSLSVFLSLFLSLSTSLSLTQIQIIIICFHDQYLIGGLHGL